MKYAISFAAALCGLLLASGASQAEIRIVSERNEGSAASGKFKFDKVPAPSGSDAGCNASISVVRGRRDGNGRAVMALQDGRLPSNMDQPGASFFFDAGTSGGRILVDLKKSTKVKQVNTYSWHGGSRGPQVYRLYASEGSAKGFDIKTARGDALEKTGWTLIASVDTRPKSGRLGGQYGVSVSDSSGGVIGAFRYLLFDVSPTDKTARFGNTFFSEIDVDDGKVHKPEPTPGIETVSIPGKCAMVLDYSEMPELKEWVDKSLKPVCVKWYPIIVKMLADEGFEAPKRFSIAFRRNMGGVAGTGGTRIYCAGNWFKRNLQGEALGAVVHEMVHVVQQYRPIRGGRRNPGWMVEGLADYLRWFCYEPKSKRPRVNPARAKYTDSYRTTGAFIHYAVENCDKDIVRKFNAEMRKGRYAPELWKKYTGKTIDELWAEYIKTLPKR